MADFVRLVLADLAVDAELVNFYSQLLSDDERQRAARLVVPEVGKRFIVGRGVLRCLLAERLEIAPAEVRFQTGPHGKPALAGPASDSWQFNVSHTGDLAAFALAEGRALGVDVESRRHRLKQDDLAARFFSESERAAYFALPEAIRPESFYRIWTCKEAYLKAIGAGLSFPLSRFTVSARPDEPPGLLQVADQPAEPARWTFVLPDVGPDAAAALAVAGHGWILDPRQWSHADLRHSRIA